MNPTEVLAAGLAPGTQCVYFLGCFESRVTVYAQQVRALNLAGALVSEGKVRPTGKIAVIGGGAAGMTAAAAFISLCPDLQKVVIFEKKPDLLHMQLQSHDRYLHPHVYDWPREGSLNSRAGLPVLDWEGGAADSVAKTLTRRFKAFRDMPNVEVRTSTAVTGISPLGVGCRILLDSGKPESTVFDAAIISVGFGYEKFTDLGQDSYWNPSTLSQPIRNDVPDPLLFISGNGDGALVDFSLAAYQHIPHVELCRYFIEKDGLEAAKEELLKIEGEAEVQGDSFDLFEAYRARIIPLIPDGLLLDVHEKLRTDAKIRFHTRSEKLFRRSTSILNRFIAFLAIHADSVNNADAPRILVSSGKSILPPEYTADGSVLIEDESPFTPNVRVLRFGAESEKVMRPFGTMATEARKLRLSVANTYAGATPKLTNEVKTQFETIRSDNRFIELTRDQVEATAALTSVERIELRRNGTQIRWNKAAAASLNAAWDAQTVEVQCNFLPQDSPELSIAILRLLAHSKGAHLKSPNSDEWSRAWRTLTKELPSLHTRYTNPIFSSADSDMHLIQTGNIIQESDLASELQDVLDRLTLDRLNVEVNACLSDLNSQPFGWEVAPALKTELRTLWIDWHQTLGASQGKLRRFLVLMIAEQDALSPPDQMSVRVGSFTVASTILRSTLFALHVAVGLPNLIAPNSDFPGNLANEIIRAHACGVSWISGIDIESSCRTANWSSRLILLSELRSASILATQSLPRLVDLDTERPSLTRGSALDSPVIIGSDEGFRRAAFSGKQQLQMHFETIFTRLAVAAENSLER